MLRRQPDDAGSSDNTSDEELLSAFMRGEREMFAELVYRYEAPLYGFICRLTGSPDRAPDLFQETFMRAFEGAGTFSGASSFRTWLYAIAANVCRSQGRKERRAKHADIEVSPEPANGSPGPDGAADSREIGHRIAQAVGELPDEQREVFILKVYQDMTYPEVAEAVARPIGTVKSQMRLAVAKLRAELRGLAEAHGVG